MRKLLLSILFFMFTQRLTAQLITHNIFYNQPGKSAFAVTQSPAFSLPAGFYSSSVSLSITVAENSSVRYTIDGSPPTENSILYTQPISIDSTVVIRACAFSNSPLILPSAIITQTYFINFSSELPVFSLSTHPGNLFNWDTGIYVLGPNASPDYPYLGANFWQDWERPVHVEFFETNHQLVISQDAGISINGGSVSRTRPMQSLRLTARDTFGISRFDHRFFPQKPIDKYKMLVLRNSSGDYNKTHFRDGCLHKLMIGKLNIDLLCYRPSLVFINGQYWGIHNIREKFSKHYLEENYGVDGDNVDLLEEDSTIIHGDYGAFNTMFAFVTNADMSIPENYDSACRLLDIPSLADYFIAETYLSNIDWPKNNVKYWRLRENGWKWRYLLMDLDISLGNWGWAPAEMDVLGRLLGPYGYDNKHARLLKALLRNKNFREYFINRYADLVNTLFSSSSMWKNVEETKAVIESEMPRHFQRWTTNTVQGWNDEIYTVVKPYIEKRPAFALKYVQDTFNLKKQIQIKVNTWPPNTGIINLNTLTLSDLPWQGTYFDGVAVNISVKAVAGYHFSRWTADSLTLDKNTGVSLKVNCSNSTSFTALMEPDDHTNNLFIFPNPASSLIHCGIILDEETTGDYIVIDKLGNEVLKKENTKFVMGLNLQNFDLSGLSQGLYLIKLITPQKVYSGKIIKAL